MFRRQSHAVWNGSGQHGDPAQVREFPKYASILIKNILRRNLADDVFHGKTKKDRGLIFAR